MTEKKERANRYSLIFETINNNYYYYDANKEIFVKMYENETPAKTTLEKIDFLTANIYDKSTAAKTFGIDEEIKRAYITYQFKGERRIAPVFNNKKWAYIASTYKGNEIDFKDKENLSAYNEVYYEIADLNSKFGDVLTKNEVRLINLNPETKAIIIGLRAHEKAIKSKNQYEFSATNMETAVIINEIYSKDRYGFYMDLKKSLSEYREFRTVYLNYCKFKKINESKKAQEEIVQKKKVLVPPHQISMFEKEI